MIEKVFYDQKRSMLTGLDQIKELISEDRRLKNSLTKLEYLLLGIKNEIILLY